MRGLGFEEVLEHVSDAREGGWGSDLQAPAASIVYSISVFLFFFICKPPLPLLSIAYQLAHMYVYNYAICI